MAISGPARFMPCAKVYPLELKAHPPERAT